MLSFNKGFMEKKEKENLKKKKNKKSKPLTKKQFYISIGGLGAVFVLVVALLVAVLLNGSDLAQKWDRLHKEEQEDNVATQETVKEGLTEEEIEAAHVRYDLASGLEEAWEDMWLKEMDLGEDPSEFMTIDSCEIYDLDTSLVCVSGVLPGIPKSDSDDIYLFALDTYETSIPADAEPLDTVRIEKTEPAFKMFANLNYKQAGSRLYKKFVIAAKVDGKYEIISGSRYITNPEKIAKYNTYKVAAGIKGLLIDPLKIYGSELDDLGVQQGVYNILLGNILGSSGGSTVYYEYGGKTYAFNGNELQVLDKVFSALSSKGIQVTAILLNDSSAYSELKHPQASGSAPYNMFNASTSDGVNAMAAVASFLADRYSGKGYGLVSNWVVGNEINMRLEWNNYTNVSVEAYTQEYADGFRVIYNAIKSVNGYANVYMPLDQTWNRNQNNGDYDGRDVLDSFADYIREKGDIDWGLAYHPYPVPLTNAKFWDTGSYAKYTTYSVDTPMVSMHNLYIVTDYMCGERFLDKDGNVRSIILSEEGFTSTSGESVQAAAYAYAYYIAANNQYIDGFMISRQTDSGQEASQGMAFGLTSSSGAHKQVYNVFKHINQADGHTYTDFALSIIGVDSWSEIIRQH